MGVQRWIAWLPALLLGAAAQAEPPPASAFARLPAIASPALSPDGERIAHLMHDENGDYLVIRDAEDFSVLTAVDTSSVKARGLLWANDDAVVMIVSDTTQVRGFSGRIEYYAPYGVDLTNLERPTVRQLMRDYPRPGRARTVGFFSSASVLGLEPDGRVLMTRFSQSFENELYSVDPRTDQRRLVDRGDRNTYDWVTNERGEPIVRVDYTQYSNRYRLYVRRDGAWRIAVEQTTEIPRMDVYGVDAAGDLIVGVQPETEGFYGLHVLSTETGEITRPYHAPDGYDVAGVIRDPYTNIIVGANVQGEASTTVWFDEELAEQQALLDATLPDGARIASWSRDRQRFLVVSGAGNRPTAFFVYYADRRQMATLGTDYPEVLESDIAPRVSILYTARDGVRIPAYLTMADDLARPAPLVVLPHGGPESRDVDGFDWLAHFIASRGYVVLQPNFRGSSGYGRAWTLAGYGGWGKGVMQHDVTDGVQALIDEGIADPARVCIVGASYGGYAALAGAAFTPELYACAAAIAPVADLYDMMEWERRTSGQESTTVEYWRAAIGGEPGVGRDRLAAISPARHAEAVRAPILLLHGRDDSVVPIEQSRTMERALREAGKSVELIELQGEDHWLSGAETRLETLQALDTFLAAHIGR